MCEGPFEIRNCFADDGTQFGAEAARTAGRRARAYEVKVNNKPWLSSLTFFGFYLMAALDAGKGHDFTFEHH